MWGVEQPAILEAPGVKAENRILGFEFGGQQYELYRHPMLFISEDVYSWYKSFVATKFCQMPMYNEMSALWMDCYSLYNSYLERFIKAKEDGR